jgi:hypothetical protein
MNRRLLEATAITAVLALALTLRTINLIENPGWFTDEATHVEIARNLLAGEVRYLAVQGSWLLFARLPLFELVLAALMRMGLDGMLAVRAIAAACGVATVLLAWAGTRTHTRTPALALMVAFMLATYPQAVLYARMGFSYNLLALLMAALWTMLPYAGLRAALAAGVCWGLGCTTDLAAFAFAPACAIALRHKTPAYRAAFGVAWVVPVALMTLGYAVAFGDAAWHDLRYTLSRLSGGGPAGQLWLLAHNCSVLLSQDSWWVMALAGWAIWPSTGGAARHSRAAGVALLMVPVLLLGRTTPLYELSTHYTIPLLPFVAIGAGGFLHAVLRWLAIHMRGAWRMAAHVGMAFVLVAATGFLIERARGPFHTVIDPYLVSAADARAAAAWLNANAATDDLVIATVSVGWMVRARVADAQMAQAYGRVRTPHMPPDLAPNRWAFDPRLQQARYVVVDSWARGWVLFQNVPGWSHDLELVNGWPLVHRTQGMKIYENPRFAR